MKVISGKGLNELISESKYNEKLLFLVSNNQPPIPYEPSTRCPHSAILRLVVKPGAFKHYEPITALKSTIILCLPYFELQNINMQDIKWLNSNKYGINIALELINLNPDCLYRMDSRELLELAGASLKKRQISKCNEVITREEFWTHVPRHLMGQLLMHPETYISIRSDTLRDFLLTGPPNICDIITKRETNLTLAHAREVLMKFPYVVEAFKDTPELFSHELVMKHPHLLYSSRKHRMNERDSINFIETHPEYAKNLMNTVLLYSTPKVIDACVAHGFHEDVDMGPLFTRCYSLSTRGGEFERQVKETPQLLKLLGTDVSASVQVAAFKAGRPIETLDTGKVIQYLLPQSEATKIADEAEKAAKKDKSLEAQLKDAITSGDEEAIIQLAKELVSK